MTISLFLVGFISFSQTETQVIKSTKLDSLIWNRISDYRESLGLNRFEEFEFGIMREFGDSLNTYFLETGSDQVHSNIIGFENGLGYSFNAECLARFTKNSYFKEPDWVEYLKSEDAKYLEDLAETIVQGWIDSKKHNECITKNGSKIASVSTVIRISLDQSSRKYSFTLYSAFHTVYGDGELTVDDYYIKNS